MAGDWIKVEHATLDKPEVARFADLLNLSHGEGVELLLRFWIWMDLNASDKCPGIVRKMSGKYLDNVLHCTGFSGALASVGWLEIDEKTCILTVPNFAHHNGSTAKTRALDAKRKRQARLDSVRKMSGKKRTREEKRRDTTSLRSVVATRLPDDWVLPKAWGEWALEERKQWTAEDVRLVAANFADWWQSQPGVRATKTDWRKTWQVWVRKESSKRGIKHGATDRRIETLTGLTGGADDDKTVIDLASVRTG